MPTIKTSNNDTPDLDSLLSHIRLRGVAVGNHEMQRLQALFAQAPSLTRNELLNLLMAVLAKDEWQRKQIRRVYDRLVPYDSEDLEDAEALDHLYEGKSERKEKSSTDKQVVDEAEDNPDLDEKEAFSWKDLTPKTIASVLAVLTIATVLLVYGTAPKVKQESSPPEITQPKQEQQAIKEPEIKPGEEPLKLIKTIDHWIPHIESRPRDPWPQLLPALMLLLMSGLGFSWLLYNALVASRQQKPNRPKLIKENGRFHVAGVSKLTDYHLLNGDQRRELRWGISRYKSEQPLNRLNISVSVKRSAIEGLPQLAFEHSNHEREVWLWQDSSSTNPDLNRLVDEINHTLQRANISVQRGYFLGLPSTVKSAQGEVLWSKRHDYPETEPLVVVFADAEKLQIRQQSHPEPSDRSLQQLSYWPLLCFVDTSHQAGTLQRCLYPHDLECILPKAVANWLANQGQSKAHTADNCMLDSLHQWAIACALPNRVIMEDEIRALHNALGFNCSWQFHSLTRYAKPSGHGFDFRAQRVNLLKELKPNSEDSDFASKAIQFWIDRNHDLEKAFKEKQQTGSAWENTRKQKLLERDTALLKLWFAEQKVEELSPNNIKSTVKALYDLCAHKSLKKDIRREVSYYCCAGFKPLADSPVNSVHQINLPFEWQNLGSETQRQLLHCGFGGQLDTKVKLRLDNATKVILAGLATIMTLSLWASIYLLMPQPPEVVTKLDSPEPPKNILIPLVEANRYLAGTYKSLGHYQKLETTKYLKSFTNQVLTISWQRRAAQPAQININTGFYGSAQRWFLGTISNPKRPEFEEGSWPDLSIVVIFGDPQDIEVRSLAAKLLDTGSADQVLLGYGKALIEEHYKLLSRTSLIKDSQWIYVNGQVLNRGDHSTNSRIGTLKQELADLWKILMMSTQVLSLHELEDAEVISQSSPMLQAVNTLIASKSYSAIMGSSAYSETYLKLLISKMESAPKSAELRLDLSRLQLEGDKEALFASVETVSDFLAKIYESGLSAQQRLVLLEKIKITLDKQRKELNESGYKYDDTALCSQSGKHEHYVSKGDTLYGVIVGCGYKLLDSKVLSIDGLLKLEDILIFYFDDSKNIYKIDIERVGRQPINLYSNQIK